MKLLILILQNLQKTTENIMSYYGLIKNIITYMPI